MNIVIHRNSQFDANLCMKHILPQLIDIVNESDIKINRRGASYTVRIKSMDIWIYFMGNAAICEKLLGMNIDYYNTDNPSVAENIGWRNKYNPNARLEQIDDLIDVIKRNKHMP